MGREEGGGFRMGSTCFKIIKLKIKKKIKRKKKKEGGKKKKKKKNSSRSLCLNGFLWTFNNKHELSVVRTVARIGS